jgi:DNA-binding response OmpR family regulator
MKPSRPRILLVDDEPGTVILLRSFLERSGYEVDEAFSGADVLERVRQKSYDLVLLDFLLPDMAGNEVARTLRDEAALRRIPIIIITAFSSRSRGTFIEEGARDVVFKPVHLEELLLKVRSVVPPGTPVS